MPRDAGVAICWRGTTADMHGRDCDRLADFSSRGNKAMATELARPPVLIIFATTNDSNGKFNAGAPAGQSWRCPSLLGFLVRLAG